MFARQIKSTCTSVPEFEYESEFGFDNQTESAYSWFTIYN